MAIMWLRNSNKWVNLINIPQSSKEEKDERANIGKRRQMKTNKATIYNIIVNNLYIYIIKIG